jgi:DNA repair exonuclease SbcCD nuclease subunit
MGWREIAVQCDSINFLHISDTHFGVHYALKPRNLRRRAYGDLFFQKALDVIDDAISKHKVDFILHAGDFFNRSKPPPAVIDRAVQPFLLAVKKRIPVYMIPGNHERSKLPLGLLPYHERSKLPLGLLPYHDLFNVFVKPSSFYFEKKGMKIKLTGFPFISYNSKINFRSVVKKAWDNCNGKNFPNHDYSILLTHQMFSGACIENHTFWDGQDVVSLQQIPKMFNYLACGHVHRFQFLNRSQGINGGTSQVQSINKQFKIQQDCSNHTLRFDKAQADSSIYFKNPVIAYCGSLERVAMIERYEPKGYIIGKLFISEENDAIQTAEISFHPLTAIEMVYCVWDLSKARMKEHVEETFEKLYAINSSNLSTKNGKKIQLSAVFRIKIKGKREYSSETSEKLEFLKQEAKRHNVYLMFSYNPAPSIAVWK